MKKVRKNLLIKKEESSNENVGLLTYICVSLFRELCMCGEIMRVQCLCVLILFTVCVFFIDLLSSGVFFIDLHASLPRVPWHRFIDGGFPPRQYQVSQLAGDLHSVQCTPAWSLTTMDLQEGHIENLGARRGFNPNRGFVLLKQSVTDQ